MADKVTPFEAKATVKVDTMSALHERLDKVVEALTHGFAGTDAQLESFATEIRAQGKRLGELEERMTRNSTRVSGESKTNEEQNAALAMVLTKVDTLEKSMTENTAATMAIKGKVVDAAVGFWRRNPKIETAVVALVMVAIATAMAWLQAHGGAR